jgi:hypothetical protein
VFHFHSSMVMPRLSSDLVAHHPADDGTAHCPHGTPACQHCAGYTANASTDCCIRAASRHPGTPSRKRRDQQHRTAQSCHSIVTHFVHLRLDRTPSVLLQRALKRDLNFLYRPRTWCIAHQVTLAAIGMCRANAPSTKILVHSKGVGTAADAFIARLDAGLSSHVGQACGAGILLAAPMHRPCTLKQAVPTRDGTPLQARHGICQGSVPALVPSHIN